MSFKSKLIEHSDAWVQKGLITEAQKSAIIEDVSSESSVGKLFRVLAVIGVLFVGFGVILLISIFSLCESPIGIQDNVFGDGDFAVFGFKLAKVFSQSSIK